MLIASNKDFLAKKIVEIMLVSSDGQSTNVVGTIVVVPGPNVKKLFTSEINEYS